MKMIRLLATCMIAGVPRSPIEGLQSVADEEGERLIEAGMAEDAEETMDASDEADVLSGKTVAQLRQLAQKRGIDLGGASKKPDLLAAIRAEIENRDAALDEMDETTLRETATAESVQIADGADPDYVKGAIRAARAAY